MSIECILCQIGFRACLWFSPAKTFVCATSFEGGLDHRHVLLCVFRCLTCFPKIRSFCGSGRRVVGLPTICTTKEACDKWHSEFVLTIKCLHVTRTCVPAEAGAWRLEAACACFGDGAGADAGAGGASVPASLPASCTVCVPPMQLRCNRTGTGAVQCAFHVWWLPVK